MYLKRLIFDLSKTLIHEIHENYMQPKDGSKVKLCYMHTRSFVYETETENFYKDIAKDVGKGVDRRIYSGNDNWLLPTEKNYKVLGMTKNDLSGKICCIDG